MKAQIVLGSARSDGNTAKVVSQLADSLNATVIDLSSKNILPYRYQGPHQDDEFIEIANELCKQALIVFATPVYWYAMSTTMKTFFDRFSDLITFRKDLGRAFAGRKTALLATGSDEKLPEGFEVPFQRTSNYFDMEFIGSLYLPFKQEELSSKDTIERVLEFSAMLMARE